MSAAQESGQMQHITCVSGHCAVFSIIAMSMTWIPENPVKRIKDTKTAHVMQSIMSAEEREMVRSKCHTEREIALVDFLYSSGVRVSELVSLNRQDIDFRRRRAKCFGKGRKEREITFSAECGVHLAEYLAQRTDHNEALFVSSVKPHQRLTKAGIRALLKNIKARDERLARVKLTPHVYRRTRGTDLINRGMPAGAACEKARTRKCSNITHVLCGDPAGDCVGGRGKIWLRKVKN